MIRRLFLTLAQVGAFLFANIVQGVETAPPPRLAPITFRGHAKGIDFAAFSADYTKLVTLSNDDRTIRVWETQAGREISRCNLPKTARRESVAEVRFATDGQRVVTEHRIFVKPLIKYWCVWNAETGELVREVREADDETRRPSEDSPRPAYDRHSSELYSSNGKWRILNGSGIIGVRIYNTKAKNPQMPLFAIVGRTILKSEELDKPDTDFIDRSNYQANYKYLNADKDGIITDPSGLAISQDGKLALFWLHRYTVRLHERSEPGRPSMPVVISTLVDDNLVLVDIEKAGERKRMLVPKEWGYLQLYFFKDKQPFALVSNEEKTTLKLVKLFP